jgi:hypothetical protein
MVNPETPNRAWAACCLVLKFEIFTVFTSIKNIYKYI